MFAKLGLSYTPNSLAVPIMMPAVITAAPTLAQNAVAPAVTKAAAIALNTAIMHPHTNN